ncbi:hypothetical protein [Paenibacillus alvei]|uniref:Uncharacterized protein n=1 Tax=Paenibacillus alvei TaxID=44250 RepID=A0A383RE26_PAEAL|nr:hypothetical protein [Paenibacillus alvei]SYX85093.1 conserved exported protein of unknown function [Paenibacillus alvei]
MKMNVVKIAASIILVTSLIAVPAISSAASNNLIPEYVQPSTSVLQIDNSKNIINGKNKVLLLDLSQGDLSKSPVLNQEVLDVQVMNNPTKVVILTEGARKRIEKHVYNEHGIEISKSEYKIIVPNQAKVKWVAPSKGVSERFMVQQGDLFTLYTSSGSHIVKYNAQQKNNIYEHVRVDDWDFSAYPYLAIKYVGQRTMAEDYFIHVVNLNSKTSTKIPGLEIDKQFRINKQGQLNIWNSYAYDEVTPPNATHPDPTEKQTFHALYSMSTGKALIDHQLPFKQIPGQTSSGWNTQIVGDTVFVQDLSNSQWSLYPTGSSNAIAEQQTGLGKNAKFVGYLPQSKTAYFLVMPDGSTAPEIKKITIK